MNSDMNTGAKDTGAKDSGTDTNIEFTINDNMRSLLELLAARTGCKDFEQLFKQAFGTYDVLLRTERCDPKTGTILVYNRNTQKMENVRLYIP